MPANEDALVLFCKPPGRSKRRLLPELGVRDTAELAECLLACALEDLAAWPGAAVLSPAEPADTDWAAGLLPGCDRILPQRSGNLGERLNDIDCRLSDEGYDRRLFIGMDCPLLDAPALSAASAALEAADVVLGAAEDGGVVFMGNGPRWPDLASLPWSTDRLAEALAAACAEAGLRVHWLGRWPDVDRAADLPALAAALEGDARPARQRLRDWLARHENGQRRQRRGGR